MREAMQRQDVIDVIERRRHAGIPLLFHKWWGDGLEQKYGKAVLAKLAEPYPDDVLVAFYQAPGEAQSPIAKPNYRFGHRDSYAGAVTHSIGQQIDLLPDWSELAAFLQDFPDPNEPGTFDNVIAMMPSAHGRYKLGAWWKFLHERFWAIRGMENLMLDYYDAMPELKTVGRHLIDYYKVIVDRYAKLGFDGIFVSDDLGHQQGPMMSPEIFRELYAPLYAEFCAHVHARGMHVFLHTCGDNTLLMPDLIAAGVDVIHPIQKDTMDFVKTAQTFGDQISFLIGMDVQHTLPQESPQAVRAEIDRIIEIFRRPDGGLLLSAGNGILPDTPLENIEAMLRRMTEGDLGSGR